MKNSLKLKEQRATLVEELQAAVDLATSEDRDFTEAEETRQNEIHAEVNALDGKITKAEETEKILLRNAETKAKAVAVDMGASSSDKREQEKISKRFSLTEGIRSLAQGRPLEGVLREMDQEARKEANESGISLRGEFNIPAFLSYGKESRTAYGVDSSGNDAVHSGGAITEKVNGEMALSLQAKSVIAASGATQLSGFSGDVSLPSMPGNSVAIQGGQGADNSEAAAVTVGSSAFGNITLKPTRFAGAVDISKHLMYSQSGQLDDLFSRDLGNAIASRFDKHVLDIVVARLEANSCIAKGTEATAGATAAATDFGDVGALVGKYLAGNPDDLQRAFFCTLTCMATSWPRQLMQEVTSRQPTSRSSSWAAQHSSPPT